MKVEVEDAWLNTKCNECGKLIYPEQVYRVRPEKGKVTNLATWSFCEECFKKIFKNQEGRPKTARWEQDDG